MDKAEIAKNLASEILGFMGAEAEIKTKIVNGRIEINAFVKDAGFLIGRDGEHLKAFQHILALMLSKKINEPVNPANFIFDINNYQKEREDYLAALTKNTAQQVLEDKNPRELPPMSAFDRRIIHLSVEEIAGVKSESIGEGEARRVVIKPENF